MKYQKTVNKVLAKLENEGRAIYDVGYRGGSFGFSSGDVVDALFPSISDETREKVLGFMPGMFGAYCNYLGGGLRGALIGSSFDREMPEKYAGPLRIFARVCVTRYKEIEDEMGLNADYEDGDTNSKQSKHV
jgi:hypothetical protein